MKFKTPKPLVTLLLTFHVKNCKVLEERALARPALDQVRHTLQFIAPPSGMPVEVIVQQNGEKR